MDLKFRGKDKIGVWHYGGITELKTGRFLVRFITKSSVIPFDNSVLVDAETVGQYTGVKDKNGREIYEGDVLNCIDEDRELQWFTAVRYENTAFCVDVENEEYNTTALGFVNFDYTEIYLAGNIYENPELLNND